MTELFENVVAFFSNLLLKIVLKLPLNPFDTDTQVAQIEHVLGFLNWFIPLGTLADMFTTFVFLFDSIFSVLLIYNLFFRKLDK